jgi:hypothetical protein
MQQVEDLCMAQRVIALTQLAALTANHKKNGNAPPRVRRRWTDVRRGARAAARRVVSAPPAAAGVLATHAAAVPQRPGAAPPPPLHALERDAGTLRCTECGKAAGKARWSALAYGKCRANLSGTDADQVVWERVPHRCVRDAQNLCCTRCHGAVPLHRYAAFVGRRCPAWWLASRAAAPAGAIQLQGVAAADAAMPLHAAAVSSETDWGACVYALLGHRAAGGAQDASARCSTLVRGAAVLPRPPQPVRARSADGARALFSGRAWRPHIAAQGPGCVMCIVCGDAAKTRASLAAKPCRGWAPVLPPRVAAVVTLGEGLLSAGGPPAAFAVALASRLAERPAAPD